MLNKNSRSIYLGLDLSLNHAGITALDDTGKIWFMDYCLLNAKESKLGMLNRMTLMSKNIIMSVVRRLHGIKYNKIYLCSERPLYRSRFTNILTQLAGIYYVVLVHLVAALCDAKDVTHKELSPSQVKKMATGDGKAKKEQLLAIAPDEVKQFSKKAKDTKHLDVSDSYWLAYTGIQLSKKKMPGLKW